MLDFRMTHKQKRALIAIVLGSSAVFLSGSIINLALPKIAIEFGAQFADLQWIASGYLLSLSGLMLLGGSLGDIYGRKRIYNIGIVGFIIVSFVCALSNSAILLIIGCILQGAFGALITPGALAIIDTNFQSKQRAQAVAFWAASTSGVSAIAPLLGGYIIDVASWRWIFILNIPLLIICLWLARKNVEESKDSRMRHIDWWGAVWALLALSGIIFGLIQGPTTHWDITSIISLGLGILFGGIFLYTELKQPDPMLSLALFKNSNFTAVNIATFAMYGALSGFFFIFTIYLQTTLGFSSLQAGLSSLPITLLLLLLSNYAGTLTAKYGPKIFMTIGPILTGISILLLLPLQAGADYVLQILPGMLLFGTGLALTVTPLTTALLSSVKQQNAGIASAVNNAVSRVAGLVIIALLGLFGAGQAYQFASILCAILAVSAGVLSWKLVKNTNLSDREPPQL